jgi:protein-tyrosine phosphatase
MSGHERGQSHLIEKLTQHVPEWAKVPIRLVRSAAERQDFAHEMRRRREGEPPLPEGEVRRVVVICHGNICRSPFAGLDLARRLKGVEVRTAGLHTSDGRPAEPNAREVAAEMGVPVDEHASRRFDEGDVEWADLIVAMQGRHIAVLAERWPGCERRARLLGDYLPDAPHAILDPWGQDKPVFEAVFRKIVAGNARLAELIARSNEAHEGNA